MKSRIKKQRIYKLLEKYQHKLVEAYIDEGPQELRKKLTIKSNENWMAVMQYLVYEKDVIKLCVRKNTAYIHNFFVEQGPEVLRKVFDIENPDFDEAWEYITDYLGISRGAIYEYVSNHANKFKKLIYEGKPTQIRRDLGLEKEKYDRVWNEILDILLESVSTEKYSYSVYEQGIRMFMDFYNKGRKQRSLKSFKKESFKKA